MGLAEAIREARFGPVVRVHRRYPEREDIQLSLYGLGVLFFLAVVPVFALWLNHWRFLPGVLFVVGCIAGALVAAPWYLAATRGERYAVAERGVLVWSGRTGEASSVIPWAAVLRVKGRRVTWRDAEEEEQQLTVRPLVGRRLGERRHRPRHRRVRGGILAPLVERGRTRHLPTGDPAADHRRRRWLQRLPHPGVETGLAEFAAETGLTITVCHFPPGTQCRCLITQL
jgi:hypothetical protein